MKKFSRRLIALATICCVLFAFAPIWFYRMKWIDSTELQVLISVAGSLFAAYFGARAAIKFQIDREEEKDTKSQVDAINSIVLSLLRRANFIGSMRRQILEPYKSVTLRQLQMVSMVASPPETSIDVGQVLRILGTGNVDVVSDAELADSEYLLTMRILDQRNETHRIAQQNLSVAGIEQPFNGAHKDLEMAIGSDVWHQLTMLTDQMYLIVPDCETYIRSAIESLIAEGKKKFPGSVFFEFSFKDSVSK